MTEERNHEKKTIFTCENWIENFNMACCIYRLAFYFIRTSFALTRLIMASMLINILVGNYFCIPFSALYLFFSPLFQQYFFLSVGNITKYPYCDSWYVEELLLDIYKWLNIQIIHFSFLLPQIFLALLCNKCDWSKIQYLSFYL